MQGATRHWITKFVSVAVFPTQEGSQDPWGESKMTRKIRFAIALAAVLSFAGAVGFAQSSAQAVYKSKCQMCHGAKGMADSPVGKTMKIKPINDPSVKKMTEAQMIDAVRDGMGKMKPYKGSLSDAQIKDVVTYFRTFLK